jgi:hypothetical protein
MARSVGSTRAKNVDACSARLLTFAALVAITACGSNAGTGGQVTTPASAAPTAHPCSVVSPAARPPIGSAQAMTVIPVEVMTGVPASSGVIDLGLATCVTVGVSQRVAVRVRARIPPLPAESHTGLGLLSAITVSPAVPASETVPQAAQYTLSFTAQSAGSTVITYLAATCNLPPGVC